MAAGQVVEVAVGVGDVVRLRPPAIPLHPRYQGAKVDVAYDTGALAAEEKSLDLSRYGQTQYVHPFRALRSGTTEVRFRLLGAPDLSAVEATYRLRVAPP